MDFIRRFKDHISFFAIEYNGEYAGNISLAPCDNVHRETAEIGYFLGEPYWNKGIMTTAVNLITEYGFRELGFARIHTGVYEFNPASQRVLEKCGYTKEGIFRKNVFREDRLWDEVRYAKINPEYE
jgi:RimJ/RimL family protein N-acetyltransferase